MKSKTTHEMAHDLLSREDMPITTHFMDGDISAWSPPKYSVIQLWRHKRFGVYVLDADMTVAEIDAKTFERIDVTVFSDHSTCIK